MCTPDGAGCALAAPGGGFAGAAGALQAGRGFASVSTRRGGGVRERADALRAARAAADYLNSPPAADLEAPARAEALEQLGAITSLLGAARNGLLRRFDAGYDHDADGYATSAAWLAARNRLGRRDAKAAVRQMRLLARHPHLDAATATGALTISWAREIAAWTGRIDHDELQQEADKILIDAAARGGGPGRPEADRAGRLRGVAGAGARPRRRPGRAAASPTVTSSSTPPSTAPGGSGGT